MTDAVEGNIQTLSPAKQQRLRDYFAENCTPQVEFLNDDVSPPFGR